LLRRVFISRLISVSGAPNQAILDELDSQRRNVRDQLGNLDTEESTRWSDYLAITPPGAILPRPQWEVQYGYDTDRANYKRQISAINARYFIELNNVGADLAEIGRTLAALDNQTQLVSLPSTSELINLPKEDWDVFYRTFLDADIGQFKQENAPFTITINQDSQKTTTFSSSWHAEVSIGWGLFFSASGSIENDEQTRHWQNDTTDLRISFKNIKPFNIIRGNWFKGGLIPRFLERLPRSFWDQTTGRLNVIPTQLVLAHGLSVDITTSDTVGDYVYQRHQASGGGGVGIGPFKFGGGGGSTTVYENTTVVKTGTGLHIEDTSGRAVVLAIISERPLDLLPGGAGLLPMVELSSEEKLLGKRLYQEAIHSDDESPMDVTKATNFKRHPEKQKQE